MRNAIISILTATMLTGCAGAGPNQTGGAVVGGVAGGVLGSMFGGGTGRLVGTGVGAAIGSAVGSSVGASMDRQEQMSNQQYSRSYGSAGEESAYNRGRAEREAQMQHRREQEAYQRGLRGY